jgi:hypothetical protein
MAAPPSWTAVLQAVSVAHGFAAGDVVGGGAGADVVGDADVLMLALPGTGVPGCGPFAPWVPRLPQPERLR